MKKITFVLALVVLTSFSLFGQNKESTDIYLEVKKDKKPLIIVDGKKFDFSMDLIDQSKIESVHVLKGKEAKALYNSSNGVVLITTKINNKESFSISKEKFENLEKPMVIIDRKLSTQVALSKLKPSEIEKMDILKGEKAIKKYNSPSGVIIITTKKQ